MWRRISKEAAAEIAKEVAKYIALWAIPPGIGVMGWLQDVPWFYVAVGVILSGAGIMTWLVQLDEWRSRNRVEHKLRYLNMQIHLTQTNARVAAVRFGFHLQNTAVFPIKFKIENLKTKITSQKDNKPFYPPNKEYENSIISVPAGSVGFFYDHDIILPQGFIGNSTVELQCKILYGKADRFDHALELKKKSFINFLGSEISGGQHWYDQ